MNFVTCVEGYFLSVINVSQVVYFVLHIHDLDSLRVKKTFIRKKMAHTAVSAIQTSSVTI